MERVLAGWLAERQAEVFRKRTIIVAKASGKIGACLTWL